jgi:phage baseplate assembly protein W
MMAIYKDIHNAIRADGQGNFDIAYDINSIQVSIVNILTTSKGERCMLPNFGASLKDFLFENISDTMANKVAENIKKEINYWDDRVIVNGITIDPYPNENRADITVDFSVRFSSGTYQAKVTV